MTNYRDIRLRYMAKTNERQVYFDLTKRILVGICKLRSTVGTAKTLLEKLQITQQILIQGCDILYDFNPNGSLDDSDVFKRDFEVAVVTIEAYLSAKLSPK